jgi:hypothetical protein
MNAPHPKSTNPTPMLEDNNSSEEVRATGQEPEYPHAFGKPPSPITDSDHPPV